RRQDLNLVRLPISPPALASNGKAGHRLPGGPLAIGESRILTDGSDSAVGPAPAYAGVNSGAGSRGSSSPGLFTRKQAAYIAGSASRVSTVATMRPPMIATAIGPQKTDRDSGIIARTAAAAVSTMGRRRRTADSTIAFHVGTPLALSCSIWSIRITELRMI